MSFSDEEIAYLNSQPLGRLATVAADGQPDAAPVGFEYSDGVIFIGGIDPMKTRKFRNVRDGNVKVAFVVDDLVSTDPWTPRFLRIYGVADLVDRQGQFGLKPYMRITPTISWSWNLSAKPFDHQTGSGSGPRRTVH
jgi:pyridoxamine 5'-phosphate oxidase family protein